MNFLRNLWDVACELGEACWEARYAIIVMLIVLACLMFIVAGVLVVVEGPPANEVSKVGSHYDPKTGVTCYTYNGQMQCFRLKETER